MMSESSLCKNDAFISVILVARELQNIGLTCSVDMVWNYLDSNFSDYELIIVEDSPNIVQRSELDSLLKRVTSVRLIELSYEIDYEVAVTIGLENSIGDYVFIFNPTQDPLEVIVPMVEECRKSGGGVVVGVAKNAKKSFGYRAIRPFVSVVLDEINYHIPRNATTLRCLSRSAVNSATKARNYHHQIFVRIAQCGIESCAFDYMIKDEVDSKKKLFKSIRTTLNLLVFNSTKPLRWASALGFLGSSFALIFAGYSFVVRLVSHNVADGWSSTVILISFLFMLLFVILGFFGEYLSRLLNEQSRHDPYWIVNERHSSVMVDVNRQNVLEESVAK